MFRRSPVSSFQCFRPWSTSLLCSYHIPTVMLSTCCLLAKLCLTLWPHWLYWSWSSNTLAPWCKELTHWERPWCWERLKAGGEGGDRGWDGWMASLTQWTWVWASSGRWWRTGKCAAVHGVTESKTSKQLKKTSRPGSSVHGISQVRRLGWNTISFSRGSSSLRGWTCISYLASRFFTTEPPGKSAC